MLSRTIWLVFTPKPLSFASIRIESHYGEEGMSYLCSVKEKNTNIMNKSTLLYILKIIFSILQFIIDYDKRTTQPQPTEHPTE